MNKKENIVEAYIRKKGQLIILVSGLFGCGKTKLAKNISRDFRIHMLNINDFYKKDYQNKITLSNKVVVNNWSTDEAVDWEKLNKVVNTYKVKGVVVTGVAFPTDKLQFDTDQHIHVSIPKNICRERRKLYLEEHKEKYKEEYKLIGTDTERILIGKYKLGYYYDSLKKSKFTKYINAGEMSHQELYDNVFDYLMKIIQKYHNADTLLDKKYKNDITNTFTKNKPFHKKKQNIDTSSIYDPSTDELISFTLTDDSDVKLNVRGKKVNLITT